MSADQYFTCCFHYLNAAHWGFLLIIIFIQFSLPFVHSSVSFSINSFDANANNIIYEGDAKPSLGSIELNTIDYSCRVGRAVYYEPIRLWDFSTMKVADFSTHFSFTINTRNATIYGNGLAFFLAPVNHQIPINSMGGYLGLLNSTSITSAASQNHIITVEFDSYVNSDWDPPTEHVGINTNSMRSAVYAPWNASMYSNLVANVWITYNATATNLSVFWTYDEHPVFEGNSSLSYKIDLMKHLPEWVKIGFSAATGQYAEYNTIKSWEFTSNLDGSPGRRRNRKRYVIVLVAACSIALVFGLAMAAWLLTKRTKPPSKDDDDHPSGSYRVQQPVLPIIFSYQELHAATKGFAVDRRFGEGGSAHVYKGELPDKSLVAVKRIFADKKYSFDNELNIASRLKHRNLVPFIGWCRENDELLIVYEFMPNGCLADHLSGNETILPWHIRYKIVEDLLYGIQYLHQGTEICVIHRDIKPENILLDKYFTARLCDYGIAKLTSLKTTESSTGQGTAGYQAPEYLNQSKARKEADIYSFGIVAMEIACGKRSEGDLWEWISELHLAGKITDAADGRLQGDYDKDQMERLLKVGLLCTHRSASDRPNVGEVIELLKPGTAFPEASSFPAEEDDDLSENLENHSLIQMHTS